MEKWIDLTVKINQDYLPYPGDHSLKIEWDKTIDNNGYNLSKINLNMHLGTHIDFKKHCLNVSDTPSFQRFIGKANVLKISPINNVIKTIDIINSYNKLSNKQSIIIFNFDHGKHFNTPKYYQVPVFEMSVLDFLVSNDIKLICSDLPSYEYDSKDKLLMHKDLLNSDIYLIENLTNLNALNNLVYFVGLPLKIDALEASIVRAIAKNL
ncbi:MAG: cyclase family protein [Candidatus Izimaplasma sp.]|nr:cyclase family protein [Candidatus Izimaplasma bacterium]